MTLPPTKYFEAPGTASSEAATRPPQLPSATATVSPRSVSLAATVRARSGSSTAAQPTLPRRDDGACAVRRVLLLLRERRGVRAALRRAADGAKGDGAARRRALAVGAGVGIVGA